MLLTSIPGQDLQLQLEKSVLGPESGFEKVVRIGEVLPFDAMQMAQNGGEKIEPEIDQLIEQNKFCLIRIPLNVRPTAKTTVRFLAVEVFLDRPDATCWSLDPDRVEEELKVTSSVKLTGSLKPKFVEVGASHERTTEYVVRIPRITGFGIGLPEFAWEFKPGAGRQLSGVQMLHCVVKSARGSSVGCSVRIRADLISHGTLWNTRAVNPDDSTDVAHLQLTS